MIGACMCGSGAGGAAGALVTLKSIAWPRRFRRSRHRQQSSSTRKSGMRPSRPRRPRRAFLLVFPQLAEFTPAAIRAAHTVALLVPETFSCTPPVALRERRCWR